MATNIRVTLICLMASAVMLFQNCGKSAGGSAESGTIPLADVVTPDPDPAVQPPGSQLPQITYDKTHLFIQLNGLTGANVQALGIAISAPDMTTVKYEWTAASGTPPSVYDVVLPKGASRLVQVAARVLNPKTNKVNTYAAQTTIDMLADNINLSLSF